MSQAVIDFCEGLKSTLLEVERRLGAAKHDLEGGASQVEGEARKHVEAAAQTLEAFKTHAGLMAQALRAELPEQPAEVKEKLAHFGAEAQMAMRHAVVFLAEATATGAESAAEALKQGARRAQALAQDLRDQTGLTPAAKTPDAPDAS